MGSILFGIYKVIETIVCTFEWGAIGDFAIIDGILKLFGIG